MATYTYQVQRSPDGITWSDVGGATGSFDGTSPFSHDVPYLIQAADVGDYLRCKVTDSFGNISYSGKVGPATAVPTPPPVPPTPPPTTLGDPWAWDATAGTVKSNSTALMTDFFTYCGPLGYFFIEIAHVIRTSGTPVYPVSTSGKVGALDPILYVPVGTLGGLSNDQHLWIEDQVTGRWHDLDGVSFSGGKLANWRFGSSMPAHSIQVPHVSGKTNQGATAAGFPLMRGTVTLEEVNNGTIPHPLVYTAANLGPAPNSYPSPSWTGGYSGGNAPAGSSITGHIPLGTWMRIKPSATLSSSASRFERMIFDCLKQYGMFCRDRGSAVTMHGQDPGGGGLSIPDWRTAGAPLGSNGVMRFSYIDWNQLEILVPPTP